ncbi:MAG TPA: VWA domain-containing protein [Vicinamibacterales bacterium]|jgi:VWFA-related protein|nr:VWA domain-containing protein [Vicinamibacterales bacterium]
MGSASRVTCLVLAAVTASAVLVRSTAIRAGQNPPPQDPQQPQQQQRQPTFRTGANVVRVDVTVLDRRGNPVPALTADDFEVEEDGVLQSIQSFKYVEATGKPAADDDLSLAIRSPEHAAAEAARDDVRVFLIFWDEYHIDQFESALRGREAVIHFVSTAFGPTDLVALMDPLTPTDAIRFTRDFSSLALDAKKLQGRQNVFIPTRSAVEDAQLARGGDIRRLRAEVSLSALKAAAVYLGSLREGRKAIIYISQGLRALGRDEEPLLSDAVRAANESNTAIYTVDPRGLSARAAADSLYVLAENTGGKAIVNSNAIDGPLKQVVKDASAFYLVGYSSAKNPADGRFHQIKVRVKRGALEVRARKGYWAPSLTAVSEAKAKAAAAEPPSNVAKALNLLAVTSTRHLVDVWTGASRTSDGRTQLTVAWTPRVQRTSHDEPATLSVKALDADGQNLFEGLVTQRGTSFPVPAGTVQVQISVKDAADQIVDSETRAVTVPNLIGDRLAWATPMILRARGPLEFRTLTTEPDPQPFASRVVSRSDRLLVRGWLYGEHRADATVSARLVNKSGTTLVALPVVAVPDRPGLFQIDFPLTSIASGDFVIALEASAGDDKAEAMVGIRIVG